MQIAKKWLEVVVNLQFSCRKFLGPPSMSLHSIMLNLLFDRSLDPNDSELGLQLVSQELYLIFMKNVFSLLIFKKKRQILLHFQSLIVKSLPIELNSTNLPPICWNKRAITPKCVNSQETNRFYRKEKYYVLCMYRYQLLVTCFHKFRIYETMNLKKNRGLVDSEFVKTPHEPQYGHSQSEKSEEFVTNTTAASKYIPRRPKISIN